MILHFLSSSGLIQFYSKSFIYSAHQFLEISELQILMHNPNRIFKTHHLSIRNRDSHICLYFKQLNFVRKSPSEKIFACMIARSLNVLGASSKIPLFVRRPKLLRMLIQCTIQNPAQYTLIANCSAIFICKLCRILVIAQSILNKLFYWNNEELIFFIDTITFIKILHF